MSHEPPKGTAWCGLHDIYYREAVGACWYCVAEERKSAAPPTPDAWAVAAAALRAKVDEERRRHVEAALSTLEKATPLIECGKALAMTEAKLAKAESLLRRLAGGESCGDDVRAYFEVPR